jgi:trk system potassium uptake protein TrkA
MQIIIIGGNKIVLYLAREFVRQDFHVTIINRNPTRAQELAERTKATVVLGEGTNIDVLEEADIRRADTVLALTSQDQDNLIVCQIAQKNFGVPRTIAMVNDPDNEPIFQKLGVTIPFSATGMIGTIIAQETTFEEITALMPIARGHVSITDVRLDNNAPAIGKSIMDLKISDETLIACVIRDEHVTIPRGSTVLEADDHLILISESDKVNRDLERLVGHKE